MKKSLNTYTLVLFFTALSGVVMIGGLSLFIVHAMMNKIYLIEKEVRNEDIVDQIHNEIYRLALATQHCFINEDDDQAEKADELIAQIQLKLRTYIEYEKSEDYPEAKQEVVLLETLARDLEDVRSVLTNSYNMANNGVRDKEQGLSLILYVEEMERITGEINLLHFSIISRRVNNANKRMLNVIILYLLFSSMGVVVVYIGYKLHSTTVVGPISELAKVTKRLAAGDLSVRIPTKSRTEIGVLYESFNTMAEIIQTNESKLLHFNLGLEEKVRERTRELKSAYASLKQAQNELIRMERLVTLGQIATSVNHEIKTPLNALSMNLQLLKREKEKCCGQIDEEHDCMDETIQIIDNEIVRISDILDEFVRYARFAPPVLKERDLHEIILNVVMMLSERTEEANVRVHMNLSEEPMILMLDENKLIQALVNICDNGIQAMAGGGDLTIETQTEGEEVVLLISDTGSGISEENLDKIFQPFFTSKALGLGFGLPIVQRIIEEHGGTISCRNGSDQGAIFEIRLPKRYVQRELKLT